MGLAAMSWRRERQAVVDFVGKVPVAVEEVNFYVPGRPDASMDEMESLLTPLDKNVWICLGRYATVDDFRKIWLTNCDSLASPRTANLYGQIAL